MKISVVIPVYNTERYVAEAINSVLSQTRQPDEVIVVDDGSTDRTPAILESFGGRVVVLLREHAGLATTLNAGLARATGDYFAFHDADDIWPPEKLKLQCDFLSTAPAVEAVFGMARQFVSPDWDNGGQDPGDLSQEMAGTIRAAMLIRRSAFERIGLFDESFRTIDFVEWYGRAQVRGLRTHVLPDVVLLRRIHATNTGRIRRTAQREESLIALKRLLDMRRRT